MFAFLLSYAFPLSRFFLLFSFTVPYFSVRFLIGLSLFCFFILLLFSRESLCRLKKNRGNYVRITEREREDREKHQYIRYVACAKGLVSPLFYSFRLQREPFFIFFFSLKDGHELCWAAVLEHRVSE